MKIKYLAYLLILIPVLAGADMIEWQDDDRYQWITFDNCDPDSIAFLIVGWSIDLDSGYWESSYIPTDSVDCSEWLTNMQPDRDQYGNVIPGRYQYEYWWYINSETWEGDIIAAADTNHVAIDYTIPGGCGGIFHVD